MSRKIAIICQNEKNAGKYERAISKYGKVAKVITLDKVKQDAKTSANIVLIFCNEITHLLQERFFGENPRFKGSVKDPTSNESIVIFIRGGINSLDREMESRGLKPE